MFNKDSRLIFEAYKNKLVSEDMPYPTFAKLSKHASPKSSKEKDETDKDIHDLVKPSSKEHYKDEEEQRRLDPKCWKGYHKSGTKLKDGVRVNNCVKSQNNEEKLVGGQNKLDANHDGKITGADFKLLRRKRLKGEEEQEGPYNYEDVEVKFTYDDVNYIAFGDALYDENDEDYTIENFAIYRMEDLNKKDREEVADKKIRNMAFNAVYNKAIDQSAEDLPHPSLSDPRNYLPRQ